MYALLNVQNQNVKETIVFASSEDAQEFNKFWIDFYCQTHTNSGYSCYWILDGAIEEVDKLLPAYTNCLDFRLVFFMLSHIYKSRTGHEDKDGTIDFKVGMKNNAATFSYGPLPDIRHPEKGDNCFVFSTNKHGKFAGRVLNKQSEDQFLVAPLHYLDEDENLLPGGKTYLIKKGALAYYPPLSDS